MPDESWTAHHPGSRAVMNSTSAEKSDEGPRCDSKCDPGRSRIGEVLRCDAFGRDVTISGTNVSVTTISVRDIMSTRIVTVEMDDSLRIVKEIFDSTGFHHVLVIDSGNKLFGVVSDRDLLRALSPYVGTNVETARDVATLNKRVHQIMTRKPIILGPDASIEDAVELFLANRISCVPVVNYDSTPIGIISWRDILKVFGHVG
jgi:acetoin utilization protein AcuB